MSAATLRFHHDGHYLRYVRRVNELTGGRFESPTDAYACGVATRDETLRQQAAQVVAHETFFANMAPPASHGRPSAELDEALRFGRGFAQEWVDAAMSIFGSGWVYLVVSPSGALAIRRLQGGVLPIEPVILVMDVWEHAYYLDHPDDRRAYALDWLHHLAHWSLASARLAAVRAERPTWAR